MRRSLAAVHVVAIAVWFGALAFSFLLAPTLFGLSKPLCPTCLRSTLNEEQVACTTCGALHHATCVAKGCALEHRGSHELHATSTTAMITTTGLARWERVRVHEATAGPERRLLWRLDETTLACDPARGEVPGACFELPRAATGDALARAFTLSQAIAVAMAIVGLLTVLFTPPGGALRFIRIGALALALALAAYGLSAANAIATKRLSLESETVPTPEIRADFGKTHGLSSAAGVAEAVLVLVALVLALERRPESEHAPPSGGSHQTPTT